MTPTTEIKQSAAAFAPATLAALAVVVGVFVPFIGLPIAMVSVVAIAAANIVDRRLRYVTVTAVALSIGINLVFVMMALLAARELVQAL